MIVVRSQQAIVDTFFKLKHEAEKVGLIINENKTKFMKYSRKVSFENTIKIGNPELEFVGSFK